jgi:hypothetical protein
MKDADKKAALLLLSDGRRVIPGRWLEANGWSHRWTDDAIAAIGWKPWPSP